MGREQGRNGVAMCEAPGTAAVSTKGKEGNQTPQGPFHVFLESAGGQGGWGKGEARDSCCDYQEPGPVPAAWKGTW